MGRPLSELNDDGSPVVALAQDLRQLRARAGNPTLESMARRAGLSRTVLSEAMSGKRLPSEAVLEGFVRQCDGTDADVAAWLERRRAIQARLDAPDLPDRDERTKDAPPAMPRRRWPAMVAAIAGVAVLASAVAVGFELGNRSDAASAPAPSVQPQTGQNPELAGCRDDAVVGARVSEPGGVILELVYSPKCQANWGRIIRTDNKVRGNELSVTITGRFADAPNPLTATATDQQMTYTPIMITGPDAKACVTGTVTTDGVAYTLPEPACG